MATDHGPFTKKIVIEAIWHDPVRTRIRRNSCPLHFLGKSSYECVKAQRFLTEQKL